MADGYGCDLPHREALAKQYQYHHFRNGKYPIPNDDVEQGREALKHAVQLEMLE
jgi:hypothetical protein